MEEETKNESLPNQEVVTEEIPKQEPIEDKTELKSPESMRKAIEKTRGVFRGTLRGLTDPWGAVTGQDWGREQPGVFVKNYQDDSEAQASLLMSVPDAAFDVIGLMGKPGKRIDDFYDDVTRFENENIQKARGVMSVVIPSFMGMGLVGAGTKAAKLNGITKAAATVGGNLAIDGGLGYASDLNEGADTLAKTLADSFPGWYGAEGKIPLPESWKNTNATTAEQLRWMHMWENTSMGATADVLGYSFIGLSKLYGAGKKPVMSWFKPLSEKAAKWKNTQIFTNADKGTTQALSQIDDQIIGFEIRKAEILQAIETKPGTAELKVLKDQVVQLDEQIVLAKENKIKLANEYANTGSTKATDNEFNSHLERNDLSRKVQAESNALDKINADPTGAKGYDGEVTPGLSNNANRTYNNISQGNVAENMIDSTTNKLGMTKGDNTSLVSDNMYSKGFRLGKKSRDAVEGFARQTEDMGDWQAIKNGFKFAKKEMDDAAWRIYEDIIHAGSVRDVKKLFMADKDFLKITEETTRQRALLQPIQQVEIDARAQFFAMRDLIDRFIGRSVAESSARSMDTLGRDIRTASEAVTKFGPEVTDQAKVMDNVLDKLEFLMTEYGINKYVSSWQLRNKGVWNEAVRRGEDLTELAGRLNGEFEEALSAQHKKAMTYRKVIQEAAAEDPNLAKAFVEIYALSDGDVDTILKMHQWGVNQIHPVGAIHSRRTKWKLNLLARGLKTIRFNNVLSGLAPLNAAKGSASAIIGKPLRAFTHAGLDFLKTGDAEAVRKVTYLYGAIQETNKKALVDGWNMIKRVHHDDKGMINAFRKDYIVKETKTWEAMDALAANWKANGQTGRVVMYETAKNLNKIGANRWYKGAMTAMTGVDSYTNTMMAHYWSRALAYEEVAKKGFPFVEDSWKPSQHLLEAEKKHYAKMFDKQGLPTDDALKQFSGEVNLNLDHAFSDKITQATDALPITQGMFMFPRTGINDVNRMSSYLPLSNVPGFKNKYVKILQAGDDLNLIKEALKEHGIVYEKYPHAMDMYKYLKEEYQARLSWSGMITSSLMSLAIGGHIVNKKIPYNINGTGHYNHNERKELRDLYGVMEKSVQIPGTNKWVSFKGIDGLDPILSLLGDIGMYYADLSAPVLDAAYQKIVWAVSANFLNETPLAGLEPLVAFASGDGSWVSRWMANEARSYIPGSGGLGVAANVIDPAYKDVHNDVLGYIQNRTPLKKQLPNHVDIFTGEPIKGIQNGWLRAASALSPVKITDGGEPWRRALYEIGWTPNTILKTHSSGHHQYTPKERELINTFIGEEGQLLKDVKKYVGNKHFQQEINDLRTSRLKNESWTRVKLKKQSLPIFTYLNKSLTAAQKRAEQRLAQEYPAIAESIDQSIKANELSGTGRVKEAIEMADKNERDFKIMEGVLQYANPPKK